MPEVQGRTQAREAPRWVRGWADSHEESQTEGTQGGRKREWEDVADLRDPNDAAHAGDAAVHATYLCSALGHIKFGYGATCIWNACPCFANRSLLLTFWHELLPVCRPHPNLSAFHASDFPETS